MRLIVTFENPPESSIVTPGDLIEWLRKRGDAYFSYVNQEGNLEDGAVVNLNGDLFIGFRPSRQRLEDFDDWRNLEELRRDAAGRFILELENRRHDDTRLLTQLNVLSQFTVSEHRRL